MNILIIQTAFIGDSILALSLVEQAKKLYPQAKIHFLLRKGNEDIAKNHQFIDHLWIWNKKESRNINLIKLIFKLRAYRFDYVLNIHRHASSGIVTALMKSKNKIGFKQNPLSFLFSKRVNHQIPHMEDGKAFHEVQRNFQLLQQTQNIKMVVDKKIRPKMFFNQEQEEKVKAYQTKPFVVVVPASVWFTKQWAVQKWKELVSELSKKYEVLLIGAPNEKALSDEIIANNQNCQNLCGKLSLSESACLMKKATRVFVNDSAAMHLASSVNAPTTAIFNSTIPEFGYYPLADDSCVVETRPDCKPCGLHGHKSCPKDHFRCALDINVQDVLEKV